jgi:O-antigen ligase
MNLKKSQINFHTIYFYTIALFAFTMPLSRAAISLFVILLPVIWIIEGNIKNKWHYIKQNKALLFFLLFLLFSFASILWTSNYDDAKRPLRLLSYFFTLFVIATSLKKEYVEKIISSFLAGMFISEIIAYGVFFELWTFKYATTQNPSPFMNHLDYSVFLAFSSILLLYRLFSKHYSTKEKLFLGFFFLTVTGNLFLSTGRTGQVAFLVTIFVMSFLHFKFSWRSILLSILLISTISTSAFFLSKSFQTRIHQAQSNISQILQSDFRSSWGIRTAYWITTYNILKENPLIGVGIGDYLDATKSELSKTSYDPKKFNIEFMGKNTPHNQYLLILTQIGIIGFMLFLIFVIYFIKYKITDKGLNDLSILFMSIFLVSFLADTFLMQQYTLALFSLFIGLFLSKDLKREF